jgi:hypothetical protein
MFTKKNKEQKSHVKKQPKKSKPKVESTRIGELGEYKINIQLDQLPKNCKYLSDLLILNPKSKSGYSQIDHVVLTSHAIFVIETKNYQGTIYGNRERAKWNVNGKFPMINPFHQNFGHIQAVNSILNTVDISTFISMVSFTRRCTFKVNEELRKIHSNDLIVYDTELSDFISRKLNVLRLQPKIKVFSDEEILFMFNRLNESNITDLFTREKHINLINSEIHKTSEEEKNLNKCVTCGKKVSEKVKNYCLTNKEKFQGKVYCYEHQNAIPQNN